MNPPTRYDSRTLDAGQQADVDDIKFVAEQLAKTIERRPGRCASVALTHLQTAVMFGVRAVAEADKG